MSGHELWLDAASSIAPRVDHLFFYVLAVALAFAVGIALTILYFCIRYRRVPGRRRALPHDRHQTWIELSWTLGPFALCLVMFIWGADVYVQGATFPPDAEDVFVVAKQWMWKVQHAGGQREIDEIHVPLGKRIRLVMTSEDVIHSLWIPEFRVKMDILPGRYTFLWFEATELGDYHLYCSQFCGTQHARMRGRVIVMPPEDFARWQRGITGAVGLAAQGARLFVDHGCVACHHSGDATRAPSLEGVYGSDVLLETGQTVLADENYLRESIVDPRAKIVAGYEPIMPSFQPSLNSEEVLALVAYLKTLGQDTALPGGNGLLDGETP